MGLVVGLVLGQRDDTSRAELPGGPSTGSLQAREQRLVELLEQLPRRLRDGRVEQIATPAGTAALREIAANVQEIGFEQLDFRFIAPVEQVDRLSSPRETAGTWTAGVQVTWQYATYDAAPAVLEVPLEVVDDGRTARLEGVAPRASGSDRVPSWMLERLLVRKGERTLVLAGRQQGLAELARYAEVAVPVVNRVLPDWDGSLVVVAPSTSELLDRALGTTTEATGQLAGVTAAVDGSALSGAPLHVFLNPPVYDTLGPQAAQVVVSHEATHVATDGATTLAPPWLVEGFADYVALRNVELPVTVSAAQALDDVRRNGPPGRLPEPNDFAGSSSGIGATYELAWLAARFVAEEYGEAALLQLYNRLDDGVPVDRAFSLVLGTTVEDFTTAWAADVAALASAS